MVELERDDLSAGWQVREEWMGHRDIETTQRYADYAPSAQEAELVAGAFKSSEVASEVAI